MVMHWQEIPRDWVLVGDPDPINDEIRAQKGRRQLTWNDVASIIGIKRQALMRRLKKDGDKTRTPWRYFELTDLSDAWGGPLDGFLYTPTADDDAERSHCPECGGGSGEHDTYCTHHHG